MIRRVWAAAATCALACGRSDLAAYSALPGRDAVAATVGADRCYRSRESVLLGPSTAQRNVGHPPGWLRLAGGDSAGAAALVDANGSGLNGQWKRHGPDSVRVTAFDDFLRTELVFVSGGIP